MSQATEVVYKSHQEANSYIIYASHLQDQIRKAPNLFLFPGREISELSVNSEA
jgi:hypothetical protein